MLEKLVELLGEELSKQVQEKLGEIELAIMNDGSVVKADKYEALKAEHKGLEEKYQTDISGLNSKLDSAMSNAADYDALKGTLGELKAENERIAEEYKQETIKIKKNSMVERALLGANVKEAYIDMVKSQLNIDSLNFDGDNLIGLNDKIEKAASQFPDLFGEKKKMGVPPENHFNPPMGKKQQLIKDYNEAEKNRNVKRMAELTKEIKALKE